MITIIKECYSRELEKQLNVGDKVSLSNEKDVIKAGFAEEVKKQTKERKQPIKKK